MDYFYKLIRVRKLCGQCTTVSFDVAEVLELVRDWQLSPRAFAKVVRDIYLECAEQGLLTRHKASAQIWPHIEAKVSAAA